MLEPSHSAPDPRESTELERRSRELQALHDIGGAIAETLDPEAALERTLELLVGEGWFICGEALLTDPSGDTRTNGVEPGEPRTVAVGRCPFASATECRLKPELDRHAAEALGAGELRRVGSWRFVPIAGRAVLALSGAERVSSDFLASVGDLLAAAIKRGALHSRLAEKEQQRSRLLQALLRAQEEERARISRDLHDQIGQALTALLLGLDRNIDRSDADDLRRLKEITSVTLNDVRRIALDLRPSVLDELGLEAALRRFARDLKARFDLDVSLLVKLADRPDAQQETVLYRVAQEALTNVVRHSGSEEASVVVTARGGSVHLVIEDRGEGFDPGALATFEKIGLIGMAERVELLGGSLRVESAPGAGATVYARIPLRRR